MKALIAVLVVPLLVFPMLLLAVAVSSAHNEPAGACPPATSPAAEGVDAATPLSDLVTKLMTMRFTTLSPTLTRHQADNVIVIAQVARDLEVPRYGLQIALATAMQESTLNNIDYGDLDSVGLFQQRTLMGWGSTSQIMDPVLSARAFFGEAGHTSNPGLLDIAGWESMQVTVAAQAVQRSGFPNAYAQWAAGAAVIADVVGGDLPASAGSTCRTPVFGCGPNGSHGHPTTPASTCGEVAWPVPASLAAADRGNWGRTGSNWGAWHTGTDFSLPCGTPVFAAHAGTVVIDTSASWSGPWLVKVSQGPVSLTTWYAHMQRLSVSRGEQVVAGQQIGEVGSEGNSTGCHLHFEVHERNGSIYDSDNVDASAWLQSNVGR